MIFQRIGTKKHKYILELILISIKYCPWDSPYIKVSLIRGDTHEETREYSLYKGRCSFNNQHISVPCTMYYNNENQKYLPKQAEIKIKSYNKDKKQIIQTLAKLKFDLVQYTQQDRFYEQQLQFGTAKLMCSIYMKMLDDSALTSQNNTQLSHESHLSVKTEKIRKQKNSRNRSTSKERKTFQFGKSNKQIKKQQEIPDIINLKTKVKKKSQKQSVKQDEIQKEELPQDKKHKTKQSSVINPFSQIEMNKYQKQEQISTSETKAEQKDVEVQNQKKRRKDEDAEIEAFREKDKSKQKVSQKNTKDVKINSSPLNQKSQERQFLYQKQIEQKTLMLQRLGEENQQLKLLLQRKINFQSNQPKQSSNQMSRLQQQNQKLRQKLVQKQIQISQYQLKMRTACEKQTKIQSQRKIAVQQANQLHERLEAVKNKIADMLTSAFQSGSEQLIDFVQEHFSSS